MARRDDALITFDDARWMVSNQTLRQVKSIPSSDYVMVRSDIEEYLQVDNYYFSGYASNRAVPWDNLNWLYWETEQLSSIPPAQVYFNLRMDTNMNWDITSMPSWITYHGTDNNSSHPDNGTGDAILTFRAAANSSTTSGRSGTIKIQVGSKSYSHTVSQQKKEIPTVEKSFNISLHNHYQNQYVILRTYDFSSVNQYVQIYTKQVGHSSWFLNGEFMATRSNPVEWQLTGLTPGVEYDMYVTFRQNTTSANTTWTSNTVRGKINSTMSITNISSTSFSQSGSTINFDVNSNASWSITKPSWITIGSASGNGTDTYVTATASANTGSSSRSGTIKATATGGTSDSFSVSQAAPITFSISPTSKSFSNLGGSFSLSITSASSWTASAIECTINNFTTKSLSGSGNANLLIFVPANSDGFMKIASVMVSSDGVRKSCQISIAAGGGGGLDPRL